LSLEFLTLESWSQNVSRLDLQSLHVVWHISLGLRITSTGHGLHSLGVGLKKQVLKKSVQTMFYQKMKETNNKLSFYQIRTQTELHAITHTRLYTSINLRQRRRQAAASFATPRRVEHFYTATVHTTNTHTAHIDS